MTQRTDRNGTVWYYNDQGQLHREDGPAIENPDGINAWYKNSKLHRLHGPALITPK